MLDLFAANPDLVVDVGVILDTDVPAKSDFVVIRKLVCTVDGKKHARREYTDRDGGIPKPCPDCGGKMKGYYWTPKTPYIHHEASSEHDGEPVPPKRTRVRAADSSGDEGQAPQPRRRDKRAR